MAADIAVNFDPGKAAQGFDKLAEAADSAGKGIDRASRSADDLTGTVAQTTNAQKIAEDQIEATHATLDRFNEAVSESTKRLEEMIRRSGQASAANATLSKTSEVAAQAMRRLSAVIATTFSVRAVKTAVDDYNALSDAMSGAQLQTGLAGDEAESLARRLQVASSNALDHTAALQKIAENAQTGALGLDDLAMSIQFASVNAKQSGDDAAAAVDQLTAALIGGSAESLKMLGVLPQGIDDVRASYDQLHGVDAFNRLTEDARKAEIRIKALEVIKERTKDLETMGLTGQNSMDRLSGSTNRLREVWADLVNSVGVQTFIDFVGRFITKLADDIELVQQKFVRAQDAFVYGFATISQWFEAIGLVAEGTGQAMVEAHETGKRIAAETEAEAKRQADENAARIKMRRDAEAAAAAELQAQQAAEKARREAAAKAAEKAERDRLEAERAAEKEREQFAREEEKRLRDQMRLEEQQARERQKQLDDIAKKEQEAARDRQRDIDKIASRLGGAGSGGAARFGKDGATAGRGPDPGTEDQPQRPQGLQLGGPFAGLFGGLIGAQQQRFARAGAAGPLGPFGGPAGQAAPSGAAGQTGAPGSEPETQAQLLMKKIRDSIDEKDIRKQIVEARIKAVEEERDAMIAELKKKTTGGTLEQRAEASREIREVSERAEKRTVLDRKLVSKGRFTDEERAKAEQELIDQTTETLAHQTDLDRDIIEAVAQATKNQAEADREIANLQKAVQVLLNSQTTITRTRRQRAGKGL